MSLRKQLLAFGLLTLVLPWAGYRFVQEMEAALRSGLERALLASADTVAAALDDEPLVRRAAEGLPPDEAPAVAVVVPASGRAAEQDRQAWPVVHAQAVVAGQVGAAEQAGAARQAGAAGQAGAARQADAAGQAGAAGQAVVAGQVGATVQPGATQQAGAAATKPAASAVRPADSFRTDLQAAVYAPALKNPPRVDGVRDGDDWSDETDSGTLLEGGDRYWAGINGRYLYLYVAAADRDIVYEGAPGDTPYGDRLVLGLEPRPGALDWLLLATRAPGTFRAQHTVPPLFTTTGAYEDRVVAAWQETADGFGIEVRVPLSLVGSGLGIALVDVDQAQSGYTVRVSSSWDVQTGSPGPLIYQRPALDRLVSEFDQKGNRFRVLNLNGWVLADAGSIVPPAAAAPANGLGNRFFRAMLRRDDPAYAQLEPRPGRLEGQPLRSALGGRPATAWYRDGPANSTVVAAAVPIRSSGQVLGAVLLEQASDPILTLTNRALVRLMTFTLLATAVAAAGLLGFATLLSLRVRRLARAAETALGPKGEIEVALPGRGAHDEIGDLARSFGRLLERLREHTQYLRTLASKLSHELRTPLAVVSTSLDNLEQEVTEEAALPYLQRLRGGAGRLDAILAAMAEATRMEQAIGDSAPERFDLGAVVDSCCKAYADIYSDRRFVCRIEGAGAEPVPVRYEAFGSPELTAQLIDKLINNAVGFSPSGSLIEIELSRSSSECCLRVKNRGPLLPAAMRSRLFDSLVSVRDRDDGQPHLGLGLYIVALIAEFHGGRAEADNLPDGTGAVFSVWYPCGDAERNG